MTDKKQQLIEDLAPFADLGTDAPHIIETEASLIARFVRDGVERTVTFELNGSVREVQGETERRFTSLRALLASPSFTDLGRWADSQKLLLQKVVGDDTLPVLGRLSSDFSPGGLALIDAALAQRGNDRASVNVLLIDGPAGIGKTSLLRTLAHSRAASYRIKQNPLILHVESRGRVLQNITDLMAFSLQTLRVNVTYDQIPCLVRNGLVTLAIDGFDELGDPNGYELAWAQLNDLLTSVRGNGSIVLSGRETFISRDRIRRALNSLTDTDHLETFTLDTVAPNTARNWLADRGWSASSLESETAKPLFENGSYALRPFFLRQLADPVIAKAIEAGTLDDLLSFLIDAMLKREATKFGREVEAVTTEDDRIWFVRSVMEEVARDLAENQTDAISGDTLVWLSDMVGTERFPPEILGILRNRVSVIAFLGEDLRRGYRRFIHEQVGNFFLAQVTIGSIVSGELPKFVRRNLFGAEFLENFTDVIRHVEPKLLDDFDRIALEQMEAAGSQDRAKRNLAALVLASRSVSGADNTLTISNVDMDEVYLTDTVAPVILENVTIAQLDGRGTDMRQVSFAGCTVVSMLADEGTIPPGRSPRPFVLSTPGEVITDPHGIRRWLRVQYRNVTNSQLDVSQPELSKDLSNLPLFDLLTRLVRHKPFWLVDGEERTARRILDDPQWPQLKSLMAKHEILVERDDVPASGPRTTFFHVKNKNSLLKFGEDEPSPFILDLFNASMDLLDEGNAFGS